YVFSQGGQRLDRIDPRTGSPTCRDLLWGHVWLYDYSYYYSALPSNTVAANGQPIRRMQFSYPGDNLGNYIPPLAAPLDPFQLGTPAGFYGVGYDGPSYGVENATHPFVRDATFIPETTRFTFFADGAYQVTDAIEVFAEFLYNQRETYQNGARQFWQFGYTSD